MATLFDSASLVMIPSGYKDDKLYSIKPTNGDGDFTFSRDGAGASPATRVNASGLIEKGRENLALYSEQFDNAVYGKTNVTITADQLANPLNGATTADLMTATGTGTESNLRISNLIVNGAVQTISIYAKYNNYQYIYVRQIATNKFVVFDIQNGSVVRYEDHSSEIEAKVTNAGNGWYRLEYSFIASSMTANLIDIGLSASVGNFAGSVAAGSSAYIFGFQLEESLVATDYIATTTAPVSAGLLGDMPRLDYSGGATCPSLLLEPSRVNVLPQSEYLGASVWTKTRCTIDDNTDETLSPEGVYNASKMVSTDVLESYAQDEGTISGTKANLSFFAKKGDLDFVHGLIWDNSANGIRQWFNVATGQVGGSGGFGSGYSVVSGSAKIEDFGNGWYRCSYTANVTSGVNAFRVNLSSADNTLTSPVNSYGYFYGVQAEDASYPTSYIPTYGSASTRGADSCSSTALNDTDSPTTYFVEFTTTSVDDEQQIIQLYNSTSGLSLGVTINFLGTNSGVLGLIGYNLESFGTSSWSGLTANTTYKLAFVIDWTNKTITNAYLNATGADGSVSARIDTTTSALYLGSRVNDYYLSGGVNQFLIFPTALTDAECIALTTL